MQFGSMLVYCTVYDMCVCGGPTSIFFQGAPNPLAMALGCSIHLQKENKSTAYGNIYEHSGCVGTECIRVVEGNEPFWHRGKKLQTATVSGRPWESFGVFTYTNKCVPWTPASFSLMVQTQNPFTRDLPDPSTAPGLKRKRCHYCGPKDNKTSMVCVQCKTFTCKSHATITVICQICKDA